MQQIRKLAQTKKRLKPNAFCKFNLVQLIDLSWNIIEPSLVLMYRKLIALGFAYYNGDIQIVEPETEETHYHVD